MPKKTSGWGGKRRNSGPPKKPNKNRTISISLKPEQIEWLREQDDSNSKIIQDLIEEEKRLENKGDSSQDGLKSGLEKKKVSELREIAQALGLSDEGKKQDLIDRINNH